MFVLSKIVAALLDPFTLVSLLLALATILLFTRRWQLGRGILAAVVTFCAVAAALPLGDWLIAPLEDRFPPPNAMPAHVDGIIVLGGAIDPGLSAARGQAQLGAAAERVTALVPLAARYPDARLVYTGGSGSVLDQDRKEAPVARQFLSSLGLDPDRVAFEDRSRNTRENALYSREIVQPSPDAVW
ncbi:MAG TPA: YdcF family protein, partial [Candidatus Omnitrophota bacterium]|nr:YdcF family protein [Candidatus Omnitrophota bacterium]